ncbi:MAG TPA: nickel pincer cofactor biosynthesis protein LarC [Kiritimatiellia bacterium]|nr:nickel pincer cofactor biosynthesis protein LarC [Kiritimatiellia bacterium]
MKILAFDSIGGASGDMILAALADLGVDVAALSRELATLGIGPFEIESSRAMTAHLAGTRVRVVTEDDAHHHHHHDHPHDHHHAHEHGHEPAHHHHAPHRGLAEIEALIGGSALPPAVKERALCVFRNIGEVEARMHGTTVDKIHFHEIGAVDSIVDIVGCCLALHRLGVDAIVVGPLPQGRGVIQCAHGTFPNPAPATVELLRGMAIAQTDEPYELVTPTGAALLADWKTHDAAPAGAVVRRIGYGVGHRELRSRPNLLRAVLLEADEASSEDACLVLETNLDDITPELIGALTQRLLAAGALDVFTVAAQMKKQRPGVLLTVLCRPSDREPLLDLIFRESTTFGVREYPVRRTVLARRIERVPTPYGEISVKLGEWKGDTVVRAPEMEDCIRLAREHNVPVRLVYEAAQQASRAPAR